MKMYFLKTFAMFLLVQTTCQLELRAQGEVQQRRADAYYQNEERRNSFGEQSSIMADAGLLIGKIVLLSLIEGKKVEQLRVVGYFGKYAVARVITSQFGLFNTQSYGFINNKKEVLDLYDFVHVSWKNNIAIGHTDEGLVVLDTTLSVISGKYNRITGPYENGTMLVQKKINNNWKWGAIDKNGKEIFPIEYDFIRYDEEGEVFILENSNRYGFTDLGDRSSEINYKNSLWFSEGLAPVVKKKKWGYIDKAQKTVIPYLYDDSHGFFNGLAGVRQKKKWGFIDSNGTTKISFIYDKVYPFKQGVAAVKKGKKWGYIDTENNIVIPFEYEQTFGYAGGLMAVMKDEKWGFIDKDNQVLIPLKYDRVGGFQNGLASATLNGKSGYIDLEGNVVIDFRFDSAFNFGRVDEISPWYAHVMLNGKRYLINRLGEILIEQ
tara:strand:- start:4724 stop:6025 length:1302 start_codon:yes stop_codon:yes gene_type:complete